MGEAIDRVRPLLAQLHASAEAGEVLLVAHQAVNMALKAALSGRRSIADLETFRQGNDEVDVWDVRRREATERVRVS